MYKSVEQIDAEEVTCYPFIVMILLVLASWVMQKITSSFEQKKVEH